jgi:hypothetical protein
VNLLFRLENGLTTGDPGWVLFPFTTNPAPGVTYTVVGPHDQFGSTIPYPGFAYSATFASFSDLRADADGIWTVTSTSSSAGGAVSSVYHVGVSLDIPPTQMVPRTLPIVPVPGQVLSSNPIFSWPGGLDFVGGFAEIYGDPEGVISTNLAPGTTSWSPGPLPDGNFTFMLHLYGPVYNYNLPITSELVSGPDMGPINVTLNYVMNATVPFSIPEPAPALPALCLFLAASRRRRFAPCPHNPAPFALPAAVPHKPSPPRLKRPVGRRRGVTRVDAPALGADTPTSPRRRPTPRGANWMRLDELKVTRTIIPPAPAWRLCASPWVFCAGNETGT